MGANGRAYAERQFNIHVLGNHFEKLICNTINIENLAA
jgi:hypothetical protein